MTVEPSGTLATILADLQKMALGEGSNRPLPPVEKWHPAHCGDANIRIKADGSWWHEGTRMTRESLVRLFSTILRKDDDGNTYLVTPGEKVLVTVEDAPFLGTRVDRFFEGGQAHIAVTTNLGDVVTLGASRGLRVETSKATLEPRPYALVRGRLEARILRAPFYELVDWAEERKGPNGAELVVMSGGVAFSLGLLDTVIAA
jgi:uncharacterized protein